ncbi:thermonuclease family protein [Lysinibacillus xylanilyticus]|uniref:thermonuclease family protein n=1 Tax=Lysinibacillus xylanilyticus TaxID=582475 RepID=UPI002B2515BE|nr:thermonuclease family protein [Lysinibacillus xylanilyticus]MEB2280194.1 thermonuclease family protein [Lysinibacillus xylanilyticus]
MKKLIIILLAVITLSGCKTPNYNTGKDLSGVIESSIGTEIATYNGYVIEVTEDNMIRIKVPKRGDKIQKGLAVHEDGIIKVALASVKLPANDLPLSNEASDTLKNLLLNKEITLDVLNASTSSQKNNNLNEIQGYIHLKDSDTSIQEILIENGLAIIDKNSPFVKSYMSELEDVQTAARNNSLGVWAIDGFVNLSNSFEGDFSNFADVNEVEMKKIIQGIKAKGSEIEKLIEK